MKRNILAVILVLSLMMMLFAGCSNSGYTLDSFDYDRLQEEIEELFDLLEKGDTASLQQRSCVIKNILKEDETSSVDLYLKSSNKQEGKQLSIASDDVNKTPHKIVIKNISDMHFCIITDRNNIDLSPENFIYDEINKVERDGFIEVSLSSSEDSQKKELLYKVILNSRQ